MTSANGVKAEQADHAEDLEAQPDEEVFESVTAPESTPEVEAPKLASTSLDYWRQMTQRQVDRLQDRVDELEAEAGPLRQQINSLKLALSATAAAAAGRAKSAQREKKQTGAEITEEERALVRAMARDGATTEHVRARLPHVKPTQIYSALYGEQQKMQREAQR